MQAYSQIDSSAEVAWRSWQGSLSGKCGISLSDHACGDSMGQSVYQHLRSEVDQLKRQQSESRQVIKDLVSQTQGAAAQDLCLVKNAWVPCRDASFFSDSDRKAAKAKLATTQHAVINSESLPSKSLRVPPPHSAFPPPPKTRQAASAVEDSRQPHLNTQRWGTGSKSAGKAAPVLVHQKKRGAAAKQALKHTPAKSRNAKHTARPRAPMPPSATKALAGRGSTTGMDVEPDYGVLVSKDATRNESPAQRAKHKRENPAFWPKGLWSAIKPLWPWDKGAFQSVQHAPHLRAHTRSSDMMGDRSITLKHSMQMVNSPLPSTSDTPLWGRLEKMATDGTVISAPKAQDGDNVWGRSHRWGPSDNDISLPKSGAKHGVTWQRPRAFGPHRPLLHVAGKGEERGVAGRAKKVWVSRNSPWAPDAGVCGCVCTCVCVCVRVCVC